MTLRITDPSTEDERIFTTKRVEVDQVRITEIHVQKNEATLSVQIRWVMGYEDGDGIFQPVSDGSVDLNGRDASPLFSAIEDSVFRYLISTDQIPEGDQV